jgi:hypothetical protein
MQGRMADETAELESLAELRSLHFNEIDIYENCGRKLLLSISDADEIKVFTDSVGSAAPHIGNHDHYTAAWFVLLRGESPRAFVLYYKEGMEQHVIGSVAFRQGGKVYESVDFKTQMLRSWAERHFPHSPYRNC